MSRSKPSVDRVEPCAPACEMCEPTLYKTMPCKRHQASGKCRYGPRCRFAHGEHQLRTVEQNCAQGLVTEEAIRAYQERGRQMAAAKKAQRNEAAWSPADSTPCAPPPPPPRATAAAVYTHNPYLSVCGEERAARDGSGLPLWKLPHAHNPYAPLVPDTSMDPVGVNVRVYRGKGKRSLSVTVLQHHNA
ncbi:hypothetical protein STCU_10463 [Strigomonas culicis]|uniref:C3H1-type domain-containing protein n=1 Tax=Strigomonas culicis TaxID=28005 RepID=S9TI06_9TRYP|nr:hypothetical protein STCU_10463 [Strigomonas culicis]|eukprot:EPY17682.1 hypothetical protein STCU_10463 [Strigomonas culicis]